MCREMEYDGIVLESWSRWAAYGVLHDPEMRNKVPIDLYEVISMAPISLRIMTTEFYNNLEK